MVNGTEAKRGEHSKEIFLAMSGGGFRATAFHLGALWVLDRLKLLPHVTGVSSASGGTLLAVRWLSSVAKGEKFAAFFASLFSFLAGRHVVQLAASRLAASWDERDARARTLVVAAADVYAAPDFVGDDRFSLLDGEALKDITEISLNATEFATGRPYRFQRSRRGKFGNGNMPVEGEVRKTLAAQLRLADVAAASAAFPGGFEPFLLPRDFKHVTVPLPPVALMDGGIDDNQGVDSLMEVMERRRENHEPMPRVVLVSDVHQWEAPLYEMPGPRKRGWIQLRFVVWFFWAALLSSCIAAVGGVMGVMSARTPLELGLSTFTAVSVVFIAVLLSWVALRFAALLRPYWDKPHFGVRNYWRELRKLTVNEFFALLELRGTSLLAMSSRVFMKHVRALLRQLSSRLANQLDVGLAYALIYDLVGKDPKKPLPSCPGLGRPLSPPAAACVRTANAMPTILWVESTDQLRSVIAAGRLTACAGLIKWLAAQPQLDAYWGDVAKHALELIAQLDSAPLAELP